MRFVVSQKLLGKPFGLLAEHQVDLFGIFDVGVFLRRLGAEIIDLSVGIARVEIVLILVIGYVKLMPVIKSRTLELCIVNAEAKGLD